MLRFFSDFIKNCIFSIDFGNIIKNTMEIILIGALFFHAYKETDGRIDDITQVIGDLCNSAITSKQY